MLLLLLFCKDSTGSSCKRLHKEEEKFSESKFSYLQDSCAFLTSLFEMKTTHFHKHENPTGHRALVSLAISICHTNEFCQQSHLAGDHGLFYCEDDTQK